MDNWTKTTPTEEGYYWFSTNDKVRNIKLFRSTFGLCTNEDGGALVYDHMYQGGYWMGPIKAPGPPKLNVHPESEAQDGKN